MQLQAKEPHHILKFKCKQCGYCCDHTYIQLYPFDIKNICSSLGISTKEFHEKYSMFKSMDGIPRCFLRNRPKCPFKENNKCTIYDNRPVRCRLFPLGRVFQEDEIIYVLPEDKCQGFDTGKKQTIAEWIENENVTESDELTSKWNSFLIKLKDSETIKKEHFSIIFKKVFYDFGDLFIKNQLEKLDVDFMGDLIEVFEVMVSSHQDSKLSHTTHRPNAE